MCCVCVLMLRRLWHQQKKKEERKKEFEFTSENGLARPVPPGRALNQRKREKKERKKKEVLLGKGESKKEKKIYRRSGC